MLSWSSFWKSVYTKILVSAILVFIGITSGIYVGNALVDKQPASQAEAPQPSANEPFVTFDAGDLFPPEEYTDLSGHTGNFSDLIDGRPTIFIFVTMQCGPCIDLLQFWKMRMQERLRPGVQVVVCVKHDVTSVPPEYEGLLEGVRVVRYDDALWKRKYHLDFWPTIAGVDGSGFVQHVQSGFAKYIEHDLVDYFFTKSGR